MALSQTSPLLRGLLVNLTFSLPSPSLLLPSPGCIFEDDFLSLFDWHSLPAWSSCYPDVNHFQCSSASFLQEDCGISFQFLLSLLLQHPSLTMTPILAVLVARFEGPFTVHFIDSFIPVSIRLATRWSVAHLQTAMTSLFSFGDILLANCSEATMRFWTSNKLPSRKHNPFHHHRSC